MCSWARIGLPAATLPDQRQRELRQAGQRQAVLLAARLVERAQCARLQTNAARRAADQLDDAFAGQRLQVLLGRVGRAKAELVGDLGAGGRRASALDRALHEIEDLLLAVGEFGHLLHGGCSLTADDLSSHCIFIQLRPKCKRIRKPKATKRSISIAWWSSSAPAERSPAARRARPTTSATSPRRPAWASCSVRSAVVSAGSKRSRSRRSTARTWTSRSGNGWPVGWRITCSAPRWRAS